MTDAYDRRTDGADASIVESVNAPSGEALLLRIDRAVSLLERIAVALERGNPTVARPPKMSDEQRQIVALGALALHGADMKAIAAATGIHLRTLYRMTGKFRQAYNRAKAPEGRILRGWKDGASRQIEAWDPDDGE